MRVIEVATYGGPDVLRVAERPDPVPVDGKVRVRVTATSVNPADLSTRDGVWADFTPNATPPIVLGWDFAGELLDPAPGFRVGQRVAGLYPWLSLGDGTGTYAELVLVDPSWLAALPDGASEAEAATIGMNAQTASQALRIAAVQSGQTLLITGASGGVGGFAVQLAAASGAHVIAVASRGDEDYVSALGAKEVISRDALTDGTISGVDAVLDAATAGPTLIGLVRDGGRFVAVSDPFMPAAERGIHVETVHSQQEGDDLATLIERWASGRLRTRVLEVLPLVDAADAHRRLADGSLHGKLVLAP